MTEAQYDRSRFSLTMRGHAGAGRRGEDLVCAAVSTLAQTLEAALTASDSRVQLYRPLVVKHREKAEIRICCTPDKRAAESCRVVFDTIAAGLKALAEQYPEHVRFRTVKR